MDQSLEATAVASRRNTFILSALQKDAQLVCCSVYLFLAVLTAYCFSFLVFVIVLVKRAVSPVGMGLFFAFRLPFPFTIPHFSPFFSSPFSLIPPPPQVTWLIPYPFPVGGERGGAYFPYKYAAVSFSLLQTGESVPLKRVSPFPSTIWWMNYEPPSSLSTPSHTSGNQERNGSNQF